MYKIILILNLLFLSISVANAIDKTTCDKYEVYQNFVKAKKSNKVTNMIETAPILSPVRDQDSVGHCFAYAASDMLEYWLKQKKVIESDQSISALGMSLNYHKERWNDKTSQYHSLAILRETIVPQIEIYHSKNLEISQRLQKLRERLIVSTDPNEKTEIMEEKKQLEGESSHLIYLTDSLKKLIKPKETDEVNEIPEGGEVEAAIEASWLNKKLCLESEINSRDLKIKEIYDNYREVYKNALYTPTDLKTSLQYLGLGQFEKTQLECNGQAIINALFPGVGLTSDSDVKKILDDLKVNESIIESLLNLACRDKKLPPKPTLKGEKISDNLPLVGNAKLFAVIDEALANNKIVGISYYADIFKNIYVKTNDSKHASTVIGSMNICGEKYYKVRNSWGKEGCERNFKKYDIDNAQFSDKYVAIQDSYYNCQEVVREKVKEKYADCKNDNCFEKRAGFREELVADCTSKYQAEKNKIELTPYFCDEEGNWIINQLQLKKGLYEARYIND